MVSESSIPNHFVSFCGEAKSCTSLIVSKWMRLYLYYAGQGQGIDVKASSFVSKNDVS